LRGGKRKALDDVFGIRTQIKSGEAHGRPSESDRGRSHTHPSIDVFE